MSIKTHKQVVADLVASDPSIQTTGFKKALVKRVLEKEPNVGNEIDVIREGIVIVPDAYSIVDDLVTIYEVIDTHKIDTIKKWKLAWAWCSIDNFYLDCKLIICDVYGGRNEIDLEKWLQEVVGSEEYPKGWPVAVRRGNRDNNQG
jgi:hypothetical protein